MSGDAKAHFARGAAAIRAGDVATGIDAYRAGLALDASKADNWYNLGYLLRCDRQFLEAISAYEEAINHNVNRPEEAWINIATIRYDHLLEIEPAINALQAALSADTACIPALINLATILEETGQREAARATYARLRAIDPGNGRALGRCAMLDLYEDKAGHSLPDLYRALDTHLTPEDRAEIAFALGHNLDAIKDYKAAFAAFEMANAAAAHLIPKPQRYNRTRHSIWIDQLIAHASQPITSLGGQAANAPIFICGMFRSGSTLIEQILSRHSGVTAGGELEIVPSIARSRLSDDPVALGQLTPDMSKHWRADYLEDLRRAGLQGRVTDKRPDNFLYLPLILAMFPEARIVHTVRHPVDNMLSVFFGNFDVGVPYGFALDDIAHWHENYRRLMDHWKDLFPDAILDCSYDALVAQPKSVVSNVLSHCGLDWEDKCLSAKTDNSAVRTLSAWQVRQPVHQRSSMRWQNYADFLPAHILSAADLKI